MVPTGSSAHLDRMRDEQAPLAGIREESVKGQKDERYVRAWPREWSAKPKYGDDIKDRVRDVLRRKSKERRR